MSAPFTITTASTTIQLGDERTVDVPFTVHNTSDQSIVGRGLIHVSEETDETSESWFSIAGERERVFPAEGTETYTVAITVPPDVPAGTYVFRFDMVGVENVDEQYKTGPSVSVQVPEPIPPDPSCRWCIPVAAAVVLVLLIAGVAYYFWPRDVEVPDVSGLTEDEAIDILVEAGFDVGVTEQPSDAVAAESVIETNPRAGDAVERGSEIFLFVSSGPVEVEIPDVVEMSQQEAIDSLHNACEPTPCFAVDVDREVEEGGIVVDIDPPPGEQVLPGTRVRVSTAIEIPDLTGEAHDVARDTLRAMCLPQPCFSVNWAGYGQNGVVGDSDPEPGEIAAPGSEVTLTTGIEIPSVSSASAEVAMDRLESACEPAPCFEVVESSEGTLIHYFHGVVMRSDPEPGEIAEPGSEVLIVVGRPIAFDEIPQVELPFDEFVLPTPTPD